MGAHVMSHEVPRYVLWDSVGLHATCHVMSWDSMGLHGICAMGAHRAPREVPWSDMECHEVSWSVIKHPMGPVGSPMGAYGIYSGVS